MIAKEVFRLFALAAVLLGPCSLTGSCSTGLQAGFIGEFCVHEQTLWFACMLTLYAVGAVLGPMLCVAEQQQAYKHQVDAQQCCGDSLV